jgi:hypothetical protein
MKQLHVITPVGLFPIPLARTNSLKTAKARAEAIANRGVWVETVFLTPSIIRMIEIVEAPEKVASIPVPKEEAPAAPQVLHQEESSPCTSRQE